MSDVIAVVASDIHLSHKPPVARSPEPDWYEAMGRQLDELGKVAERYGDVPIIYAGDIFHRWNSPPELINFAIDRLPPGYSIPGQHDLPNHRTEDVTRSAYWTLIKAGVLTDLNPNHPLAIRQLFIWAFPWGTEIKPKDWEDPKGGRIIHLAVCHAYIWKKGSSYPGAGEDQKIGVYRKALEGFDCAIFGDNHKGFTAKLPKGTLMNGGTFFRRNIDEVTYRPQIGLVHDDGTITPHYLDTSEDLFLDEAIARSKEKEEIDMANLLDDLRKLGVDDLDFSQAVEHYLDQEKTGDETREIVLEAIGHHGS